MNLDHINIATDDLDATTAFFTDVLGLKAGFRPAFRFPGAWLYGDDDGPAIVHLIVGDDRAGPTGALDHVAFRSKGKKALTDRLEAKNIAYDSRVVPSTGDHQVFFTAPFGLKIEVNFAEKDV